MLSFRRALTSASSTRYLKGGCSSLLHEKSTSAIAGLRGCVRSIRLPKSKVHFSTLKDAPWQLSSLSEPSPSLFQHVPDENGAFTPLHSTSYNENIDSWLRSDVRNMGALLGKIILQHEGQVIFEKVEKLRHCAKQWRAASAGRDKSMEAEANASFETMKSYVSTFTNEELYVVSRAFSHFLAVCNAAEMHHRSRRVKADLIRGVTSGANDSKVGALRDSHDSCGRIFSDLVEKDVGKSDIHDTICSQKVEIVLTAHPTEVNRRTLLDKKKRMLKLLEQADLYRALGAATPYQRQLLDDAMEREVSNIWQTDEVSRHKPNPQTEAQLATLAIETVLWEAVPSFLRKLDATLKSDLGEEFGLPLGAAPIKFASWMGGDR
jgi:phosphoenolpyruvate carboxylase